MNIAICFYGQPRFYKQVLPIWQEIVNELNTDIFIHTWFGQDRAKGITDLNQLVDDFNPKEILVSTPHKFMDIIPSDSKFATQSYHGMQQAFSITNSIKLLNDYEKNFNKQYDIVIRCRMDIQIKYIKEFINFINNNINTNKIFVCSNHWKNGEMFDDNIMVSNSNLLKSLFINYFEYTIDIINKTKIIPGGEQNIHRYITQTGNIDKITKVKELDFELLYIPAETLILNQNV